MPGKTKLTAVNIVNAINNQIRARYNVQLPAVTEKTFADMAGQLSAAGQEIQNAWQNELINVVGMQIVERRRKYESYFKKLYKADTTTENIEHIISDLLDVKAFNPDANSEDFFADEKPDIQTQYMTSMMKTVIPMSTNDDTFVAAFLSTSAFNDFLNGLVTRMYDSLENFDVQATKELLNENIKAGNLYLYPQARPKDRDTSLAFTQIIKQLSEDMRVEMTGEYSLSHVPSWTDSADGVILATTDVTSMSDTYSLAWAFNKQYIDLKNAGQFITIPSSGLAGGVYGGYFDKDLIEIRNKTGFPKMVSQYFGNTLTLKRWLHNQKLMSILYFVNGVFFTDPSNIGIQSAELATVKGGTAFDRGAKIRVIVSKVTAAAGKVADKFGTFTLSGNSSGDTTIDPISGKLKIAKAETAGTLTVTWTSHLDPAKTAALTLTVNGNA